MNDTTEFDDLLDRVLAERRADPRSDGARIEMLSQEAERLWPLIDTAASLEQLLPVQMPTAKERSEDRQAFLAQIESHSGSSVRVGWWSVMAAWATSRLSLFRDLTSKREQNRMSMFVLKAALVVMMIFGSAGGTAVVAANSLPDSPLYGLKMSMEEMRLGAADTPEQSASLHLLFARERVQEMEQLAKRDDSPDEPLLQRLQMHLEATLGLAAGTPDATMNRLLIRTMTMTQAQERELIAAAASAEGSAQEMLRQGARIMAQVRETAENGLADPQAFRWRHSDPPADETPGQGPCESTDCEPAGDANRYGQGDENTGQHGPGPGPCEGDDCEPAGDANRYGQDDESSGQNGPGPGACEGDDCEPVGDANRYGQDDENSGQNGPGPGACDGAECEPVGDANRYGQDDDNTRQNGPGPSACDGTECEPAGDANRYGQDDENTGQNGPGPGACDSSDCEPVGDENRYGQDGDSSGQNGPGDGEGCGQLNGCTGVSGGDQGGNNGGNDDSGPAGASGGNQDSGSGDSGANASGGNSGSGGDDSGGNNDGGSSDAGGSGSQGGSSGGGN